MRLAPSLLGLLIGASATTTASELGRLQRLGSEDGLSHNSVTAVQQDRRGFLWIGTLDGLNRFDGRSFEVWRHDPGDPGSPSNSHVTALHEDRSGRLWVGTTSGLDRFERGHGRFRRHTPFAARAGASPNQVRVFFEDREGALWVGFDAGLARYDAGLDRFLTYAHDPGDAATLAPGTVWGIQEDAAGALWILTGAAPSHPATLHRLEAGRFRRFGAPDDWEVGGLLISRDGRFWINAGGLGRFDPEPARFRREFPRSSYDAMFGIHEDRHGVLWITTFWGFRRYDPATGSLSAPLLPGGAGDQLSAYAMAVAEDSAGRVWLGTRGGLYTRDPHRKRFYFRRRQPADPARPYRISAILEDSQGVLWLGTYGAGLERLESLRGPALSYRHAPGDPASLCHDTVWHIAEDHHGGLWLGVGDGLCRYDRATDRFARYPLALESESADAASVRFVAPDPEGVLWLATPPGLVRFEPRSGATQRYPQGDAHGTSQDLLHTLLLERDVLWLGGKGGGLDARDLATGAFSRFRTVTAEGRALHGEGIFQIHRDRSGRLWLASSAGLSRLDVASGAFEHFSPRDGLPGSIVYSILEDDEGRLWLGTSQGLCRFDERLPPEQRFHGFGLADGIGNLEFNRHAAARTADGWFLFGGMDGLTFFRPDEIRPNPVVPQVALTRLRVDSPGGELEIQPDGLTELTLSPRQRAFTVEFAALDYTDPERNRYRYRLEGWDEEWIDAGTRSFARYSHLAPGRYVLRVLGSNNDGLWNDEGASLAVRVLPRFWQTVWFRVAALATLAVGVWSLHRFRLRRLLEVERMRTRIAGDLHDDLSSDLSGIALAMEIVEHGGSLEAPQRDRVSQVRRTSLRMLERLRDIVWYVNPEHDNLTAMAGRMRSTADALLAGKIYEFVARLPPEPRKIPVGFRRNLFLIFKEAIHNVARHSRAERVTIGLELEDGHLTLRVRDDGVGFEPERVEAGDGLASIRRRAAEIGAQLTLSSRPGGGSELLVRTELEAAGVRGRA